MRRGVAGVGEMSRKRSVQETVVSEQRETHRDLVPAPSLRKKRWFLEDLDEACLFFYSGFEDSLSCFTKTRNACREK